MIKKSIIAAVLLFELASPHIGQQPLPQKQPGVSPASTKTVEQQNDEDVVKITTNLVQVDAVVIDKNGKQVTDLRPEELEILEDGRPQKITNFSYVALESATAVREEPAKTNDRNAPPVPPVRLKPEQVRRTIALVVDDLGLSFESVYSVRQALKKFLDQQMQPGDLVAIIRTSGGIGALQQFTSDKRQLYASIEKIKWTVSGRGGVSVFAPLAGNDTTPTPMSGDSAATAAAIEDFDQFREDVYTVGTLGAVNYIVRGLRTLPGRKSVVLVSDGFTLFNSGNPKGNQRVLDALRRLTDLANRASVVIYTIDARGLPTLGLTAADSTAGMSAGDIEEALANRRNFFFQTQSGLTYLAEQTGGFAVRNSNDLGSGIKRVMEDQSGYYLVGYRPDESTFDKVSGRKKFHKLTLRVTRPGKFTVRMRNGFFGITDEEAVPAKQTRQQQLVDALVSPFGAAGVHLRLTSLFARDAKGGPIMRSMVHVDAHDLTFIDQPDGSHKSEFDIVAVTFGDTGLVVDQLGRTHTIRLRDKTYERILKNGFTYTVTVPIRKAGAYQLRTALRDIASQRVGSAAQFIEVPELKKNRLTLSGLLLKGMAPQAFINSGRGNSSQAENADDAVDETDPEANAAVRRFKTGMVMVYGLEIYNAQLDKQTAKPQLQTQVRLFRNGQLVFTGKEVAFDSSMQSDTKQLNLVGAMQLGKELAAGEYVLQLIVTDQLAKEKYRVASQWMDFEILK
jgi:VWFA-related protein